jgi:hypothetical protein
MGRSCCRGSFTSLSILLILANARPSSAEPPVEPMPCVFVDAISAAPSAFTTLSGEARAILGAAGVPTSWRQGRADEANKDRDNLVILLREAPGTHPPHTLGAVVAEGRAARAAWVYAGPVAEALGLDLDSRGTWNVAEQQAFARALGRVAAHELIHLFAPRAPHARAGLMRASLTKYDLARGTARLDTETQRALLDGLRSELAAPLLLSAWWPWSQSEIRDRTVFP